MRYAGVGHNHWDTECEILAFADLFDRVVYVFNDGLERRVKQLEGYGPRSRKDRPRGDIGNLTTILLYAANDYSKAVLAP